MINKYKIRAAFLKTKGEEELKKQLNEKLKHPPQNEEQFAAWISQIEEDFINSGSPSTEIRSHEHISDRAEVIYLPQDHFFIDWEMTKDEFDEFVCSEGWTHQQTIETVDEYQDDGKKKFYGYAWVESEKEGVTIKVTEGWNYEHGKPETVDADGDGLDDAFQVDGVVIVDDEGEEVSLREFWFDYGLPEAFTKIDYITYLNQFV